MALFVTLSAAKAAEVDLTGLADLSIEELADMEITSVSKRSEKLSDAPASIYAITAQDIRRSGATTIPEILRLAPNLQVARRNSVEYAISARGFNNTQTSITYGGLVTEKLILLVEDNPDDEDLTIRALRKANVVNDIQVVRDGARRSSLCFAKGHTQTAIHRECRGWCSWI